MTRALFLASVLVITPSMAQEACFDREIALAADVSTSMDVEEKTP